MATFLVKSPDGKTYKVNAPEGATQEQAIQYVQSNAAKMQPVSSESKLPWKPTDPKQPFKGYETGYTREDLKQLPANLLAGGIRGTGSIGATILLPGDMINDALQGRGLSLQSNRERRDAMDIGLSGSPLNADPNSTSYAVGKAGTEIAGTAGIGQAMVPVKLATKIATAAPKAMPVVNAIRTGGGGASGWANVPARAVGGAVTGAAQSAAVGQDPRLGAAFGAGLPVVGNMTNSLKSGIKTGLSGGVGISSGAGKEALDQAYKAGVSGGQAKADLTKFMREDMPLDDATNLVKQNLESIRKQASQAYKSDMAGLKESKEPLPIGDVRDALAKVKKSIVSPAGFVSDNRAMKVMQEIEGKLNEFSKTNGRTAADYDLLKQSIGAIRDAVPPNEKNSIRLATEMYNNVKDKITKEAPIYAKVMKDYHDSQALLSEAERTLSMGSKASKDTGTRKLLQLMRNNANTNFGGRQQLLRKVQEEGGKGDVMPILSGAALNPVFPTGLVGRGGGLMGAMSFGKDLVAGTANPATLLLAPAFSPRAAGELAVAAGTARRKAGNFLQALSEKSPMAPGDISTLTRTAVVNAGAKKKGK